MRALLLLATLLLPHAVHAAVEAPSCHCFQDRTYDAARPAAADPYVLATTRSSLLSAAFGPPKRALVKAVMTGAAPDDLWIAHAAAGAGAGADADALLEVRQAKGSWKAALPARTGLGAAFDAALARAAPAEELAALVVDDVLVARAGAPREEVRALRAAGASTSEVILATVLAGRVGAAAPKLLEPVRAGRTSWGALLASLGLEPAGLDPLVRARVR